jgi:hypothetical protein
VKLKIVLVVIGAAALLVAPAFARDTPGPAGSEKAKPRHHHSDRGKTRGHRPGRPHAKLDPAVVAQARAIIRQVKEACKQARAEAKGGEASDAAKAACKQAREHARGQLKALIQSSKGSRKQIKNQIRAAR